jgi:hypothetical protein
VISGFRVPTVAATVRSTKMDACLLHRDPGEDELTMRSARAERG